MAKVAQNQSEATLIDLQPFVQPIALILSSIILGSSIIIAAGRIGTVGTTGSTTTTTTAAPAATTTVSLDTIKELFNGDYLKFGDGDNKVLFVEIADPSCPYCHIAGGKNPELNKQAGPQFTLEADGGTYVAPVQEMRKLVEEGKASYMYIYTPGHGNGDMGMKAMYCAYEKNKFWEVHDLLMSSTGYTLVNDQVKNDKSKSGEMAEFLKSAIDPSFMKDCLDSGKYDDRLTSDTAVAQSLGVSGTPGFFVNDQLFAGAYSWTSMEAIVNEAL